MFATGDMEIAGRAGRASKHRIIPQEVRRGYVWHDVDVPRHRVFVFKCIPIRLSYIYVCRGGRGNVVLVAHNGV